MIKGYGRTERNGFTLVELIVVIAILGVLALLVVPAVTGYIANAQANVCLSNREDGQRLFAVEYATSDSKLSTAELESFLAEFWGEKSPCPSKGDYWSILAYNGNRGYQTRIWCSEHDGISGGNILIQSQKLLKQMEGLSSEEIRKLLGVTDSNFSNDTKRKKIFQDNNGWELMNPFLLDETGLKGQTLFIQPLFLDNVDGKNGDVILFANGDSDLKSNWNTKMVFNHDEGKWYERITKEPYMINNTAIYKNADGWANLKKELADSTKWKPVDY